MATQEEMTLEQQQALALASARLRLQQQQAAATPPPAPAPEQAAPPINGDQEAMRQQWAASTTPGERLGVMLASAGPKAADMVKTMGIKGAPVALGQVLGQRFFGPPGRMAGGAAGALVGSTADQIRQISNGTQPSFSFGQLAGDVVSGALPRQAGRGANAAMQGVGNVAAKAAEVGIDEGRLLNLKEAGAAGITGAGGAEMERLMAKQNRALKAGLMKDRDAAFAKLRPEGVVLPPHEIGREGTGILSSIGGKTALQQEASKRNQGVWNKLARADLGLTKEELPISRKELEAVRVAAYEPYEAIKQISANAQAQAKQLLNAPSGHGLAVQMNTPAAQKLLIEAAADVDGLKLARFKAKSAYDSFKAGNPGAYDAWQAAKQEADTLDNKILAAAQSAGDPKLVERLNASRERISKSYAVQRATNPATGLVDANDLGQQIWEDVPLTGNLRKIGDLALSFQREAVEAGKVPSPNVGNLGSSLSMGMASQGNPAGVVGGIMHGTLGRGARPFLLSNWMQNSYGAPQQAKFDPAQYAALMGRYGAQQVGRDVTRK